MIGYGTAVAIRTRREIEAMRAAGRHVGEILLELRERVRPGVATSEIDALARRLLEERGLSSSFLGYGPGGLPPYPATVCVSINEEIVHGIPGSRIFEEGDIVGIDFGAKLEGFHGDSAVTVTVGRIDESAEQLLKTTQSALYRGIEQLVPGNRLSDIGHAVQTEAEGAGFSIVRDFVGHGIGREMHEPPQIPNYGTPGRGLRLKAGMVFAIEPMVNAGAAEVRILDDGWTAVTADGTLSAHFEHTILIGESGPEILTRVPGSH
ncbi:MAG: type I methionyl aminopeptidase [Deltaproteobacteria bacterium]|nr:MAG: type I methionyl aminopeptidase [Deltaproteobacteria bacterium]